MDVGKRSRCSDADTTEPENENECHTLSIQFLSLFRFDRLTWCFARCYNTHTLLILSNSKWLPGWLCRWHLLLFWQKHSLCPKWLANIGKCFNFIVRCASTRQILRVHRCKVELMNITPISKSIFYQHPHTSSCCHFDILSMLPKFDFRSPIVIKGLSAE